jgi:hypothetical protein
MEDSMTERLRTLAGWTLLVTAALVCPCHALLTLPLLAGLLAGTAVGAALSDHPALVLAGATLYFAVALLLAWRLLRWRATGSGAAADQAHAPYRPPAAREGAR